MGFRFQKRVTLFPGLRLNLSKGGVSMSAGPRGASVTIGKSGVHGNVGIPGSGLSWRERLDKPKGRTRSCDDRYSDQQPGGPLPSVPPLPASAQARIVGNGIEIVDGNGNPIHSAHLPTVKSQMKDLIKDLLENDAKARNQRLDALRHLHHDIPRSVTPTKPSSAGKPQANQYGSHGEYMDALMTWRAAKANAGPDMSAVADEVLQALGALAWPAETNIALDLEDGRLLLDVDLPEIEDMPSTRWNAVVSRLELVEKPMSQKDVASLYFDHVSAVITRLIGHSFAAAGAVHTVALSAYTQRKIATGRLLDEYVATITVTRNSWNNVDLSQIAAIEPYNLLRHLGARIEANSRGMLLTQPPLT